MSRTGRERTRRTVGAIRQLPWQQVRNPLRPTEVLSLDQIHAIHEALLGLLSTTGMRVLSNQARQILADAGCSQLVSEYEQPPLDSAIDEQLVEFVALRKLHLAVAGSAA